MTSTCDAVIGGAASEVKENGNSSISGSCSAHSLSTPPPARTKMTVFQDLSDNNSAGGGVVVGDFDNIRPATPPGMRHASPPLQTTRRAYHQVVHVPVSAERPRASPNTYGMTCTNHMIRIQQDISK